MSSNQKRVLILGYVWPEPTSSAAGVRTLSLVDDFLDFGFEVVFASTTNFNRFSELLQNKGVRCHEVAANDSKFDGWVKELSPDVVVFDRFVLEEQLGWRVAEQCPDAIRIIDTQDFHSLRRARETALKNGLPMDLNTDDTLRELASIYRSDLTLVLSRYEYDLLTRELGVPADLLMCLGFSYPSPDLRRLPSFESRNHIAWIGNFRHQPNADAIQNLTQKIWPELYPVLNQKFPGIEMHLFGSYPPKEIMQLDQPKKGLRVLGPCEDAQETLSRYRVLFAPLRYGAGIKGKIADAWAAGTPVVTTKIGAEGMTGDGGFAGIVGESLDEFSKGISDLLSDAALWSETQKQGFAVLEDLFSQSRNRQRLRERLDSVTATAKVSRGKNIIGRILEREQLRSTKYFSKWIEEKNKGKEQ